MNKKESIIRSVLIHIILIISSVCCIKGQDLTSTNQLAEIHYNAGHYDAALDHYMRVIYFDEDEQFMKKALLNTANIYFYKQDYDRAALFYGRSALYYNDEESIKIYQQKISSYLLAQKYQEAYEEILHLDIQTINDKTLSDTYHLQFATIHYGLQEYDKSSAHFKLLISNDKDASKLESLLSKVKRAEKKNENLAIYLSAIIPGLGQIYAQDWKDGLNSFILSSSLLVIGIYTGFNYSWIDAALIVAPWWTRYHLGGMLNTGKSIDKYKLKKRSEIYRSIIELIN